MPKSSREISFLALSQNRVKLEEFLKEENRKDPLPPQELALAKELTFGVERRRLSLEFIAKTLIPNLKIEKRALPLLYMALYQRFFLEKIPLYAIVNETVDLVKRYFRKSLAPFFNAILRKLPEKIALPIENLPIFYSYPAYLVELLIKEVGKNKTIEILDIQNCFFPPKVRERKNDYFHFLTLQDENIENFTKSPDYYIQNETPAMLIKDLSSLTSSPKKILDLCAAPGGKLILAHDLFPTATFFANEPSLKKSKLLADNLAKYNIAATLLNCPGEKLDLQERFDLIIVDAPCSNSGVLHKRAEARWRINEKSLLAHQKLQLALLENSKRLLAPNGCLWYMTCSILRAENEEVRPLHRKKFCKK